MASNYYKKPEVARIKNARTAVRNKLIKFGIVSRGDGTTVQFVDGNPFNQDMSNIRIIQKETTDG